MFAAVAALACVSVGCAAPQATGTGNTPALDSSQAAAEGTQAPVAGLATPIITVLKSTIKYPNTGFLLEPPEVAAAKVPWSTAYATCLTGDSICDATATPTINLAFVTDDNSGNIQASGEVVPILHHTLSWVITYTDRPCAPAGPATSSDTAPSKGTLLCTIINFVSADNGKVLYSFQGPTP